MKKIFGVLFMLMFLMQSGIVQGEVAILELPQGFFYQQAASTLVGQWMKKIDQTGINVEYLGYVIDGKKESWGAQVVYRGTIAELKKLGAYEFDYEFVVSKFGREKTIKKKKSLPMTTGNGLFLEIEQLVGHKSRDRKGKIFKKVLTFAENNDPFKLINEFKMFSSDFARNAFHKRFFSAEYANGYIHANNPAMYSLKFTLGVVRGKSLRPVVVMTGEDLGFRRKNFFDWLTEGG